MSDEIEELHEELFGFMPAKAGVAYERIAAVVLAVLGWRDVTHDVFEQPPGRLTEHQLDVIARHPSGEIRRLIVECKDWNKTVGKGVLDALVGVRNQIAADAAAVMATIAFTKGARNVAVDEDIAILRLRRFDPDRDEGSYIKLIQVELNAYGAAHSNLGVELAEDHQLPAGTNFQIAFGTEVQLLHEDGSPAEQLREIFEAHAAPQSDGVYQQRAEFDGIRIIPTRDGTLLPIRALTWTETVSHSTNVIKVEMKGQPELVFEQLDERGDVHSGRVIVDRDLYAWRFDADNKLEELGPLIDRGPTQEQPSHGEPS